MIKNIKLFVNNNETSIRLAKLVENAFIRNDFCVSDDSFDLGIAVGGDGSFIRMVRQCDFDSDINYIGVNAGTLGFLQEANEHEINKLIRAIQINDYLPLYYYKQLPFLVQKYHQGDNRLFGLL